VVDKGGLDYDINVRDNFTKGLDSFKKGIASAEIATATFRQELTDIAATAAPLRNAAAAMKALGTPATVRRLAAAGGALNLLGSEARKLSANVQGVQDLAFALNSLKTVSRGIQSKGLTTLGTAITRMASTINGAGIRQSVQALGQLGASVRSLTNDVNAALPSLRQYVALLKEIRANAAGAARGTSAAARGIRQSMTAVNAQNAATQESNRTLFGSFQRLFTAFVAFRVFSAGTQGFQALITSGVQFNSVVEQAELSLAAILATVGRVKNAQGQVVTGAQAFAVAQGVAADQIEKLKRDAIRTTATFEDLVASFRQGLGPGLAAGLNVDEVRNVTILLAQSAAAVGIEGRAFAEEIRSVISGTGTLQNTRLKQLLPKDFNEQVRDATKAGKLFAFLQKTFGQFALVGDRVGATFEGRLDRLKDSLQQVIGAGSLPFFNALKGVLGQVADELVKVDVNKVTPKPQAVQAFRAVADGLSSVVQEVRRILSNLKIQDVEGIGALLAESFRFAGAVVGPIVEGLIRGFNAMARVILPVITGFRNMAEGSRELLVKVTQVVLGFRLIKSLALGSSGPFSALVAGSSTFGANLKAVLSTLVGIVGIIGVIAGAGGIVQAIEGKDAKGKSESLGAAVQDLLLTVTRIGPRIKVSMAEAKAGIVNFAFDSVIALKELKIEALDLILLPLKATAAGRAKVASLVAPEQAALAALRTQVTAFNIEMNKTLFGLEKEVAIFDAAVAATVSENAQANRGSSLLDDPGAAISDLIAKIADATKKGMEQGAKAAVPGVEGSVEGALREATDKALDDAESKFLQAAQRVVDLQAELAGLRQKVITPFQGDRSSLVADLQAQTQALFTLKAQLTETAKIRQQEIALQRESLEAEIAKTNDLSQQLILRAQLRALQEQESLQTQVDAQNLANAAAEVEISRQRVEEPFTLGFQVAMDQLDVSAFTATVDFMTGLVQGFANTTANLIVSAFTGGTETIQEAFFALFKQLAAQLLALLIQALVVTALTGGTSAAAGAGGGLLGALGGLFKKDGGEIPKTQPRRTGASPAHYKRPRAFKRGGAPRGVPASDTIAAWLTPGEWVMRLEAVRTYGRTVMAAINAGMIDPGALSALAGATSAPTIAPRSAAPVPSFAGGGGVSPRGGSSAGGQTLVPVIMANERNAQEFIRGGRQAFLDWFAEDSLAIRASMGVL
jgi:hypothetical protein